MKVGVALSGGGMRGFAHLGVLQALNEWGVYPTMVSGTSAGALVGALYAAGHSPAQIAALMAKKKLWTLVRPAFKRTGLLHMEKAGHWLRQYFTADAFEALQMPLVVAATDLTLGQTVYFRQGPLVRVLLASSALPVLFSPVVIDQHCLADGGILNNLPIEPLLSQCDFVVAVNTNPVLAHKRPKSIKALVEKSLLLTVNNGSYAKAKHCDVFLEPPQLAHYRVFDAKNATAMYTIGYEYALASKALFGPLFKND